jgi:hypothetical protein
MKTKFGKTDPVLACQGRPMSAIAAVRPAMVTATVANMECRVGLCFQAEGNQFQHLL